MEGSTALRLPPWLRYCTQLAFRYTACLAPCKQISAVLTPEQVTSRKSGVLFLPCMIWVRILQHFVKVATS